MRPRTVVERGAMPRRPKAEGAWEPLFERELRERTADDRLSDYLPEVAASSRHQHSVLTSGQFYRPRRGGHVFADISP